MDKGNESEKSGVEQADNLFKDRVTFMWDKLPIDQWAGFTQADLVSLVGQVSQILGITQSQASKINIFFADNATPLVNGERRIIPAVCFPQQDVEGKFDRMFVLINRSKEVLKHALGQRDIINEHEKNVYQESGVVNDQLGKEFIECEMITPFEVMVSTIAEELKHAQIALRAGSVERMTDWEGKYVSFLQKRDFQTADLYDVSLQEVKASRAKMKVLEDLLRDKFPERSAFFHSLYQQSIAEGKSVVPTISDELIDEVFIETGFDPKDY